MVKVKEELVQHWFIDEKINEVLRINMFLKYYSPKLFTKEEIKERTKVDCSDQVFSNKIQEIKKRLNDFIILKAKNKTYYGYNNDK